MYIPSRVQFFYKSALKLESAPIDQGKEVLYKKIFQRGVSLQVQSYKSRYLGFMKGIYEISEFVGLYM